LYNLCFSFPFLFCRAPLAKSSTNDDEEWGWEDSSQGGDDVQVELTSTKKDDDQDLTMAFSITGKKTSMSPQSTASEPVFHRNPHTITSNTIPITSNNQSATSTGMALGPNTSTFSLSLTNPITSLETTTTTMTTNKMKATQKPTQQSEDVFTSMGLASTPNFTPTTSKSALTKSSTTANKSTSLAAIELGLDSNWDDDGDLDDLLDD
jgi:hypothetical protein